METDKELAQYLIFSFCKEKNIQLETHPKYPNWYVVPMKHVQTIREEIEKYNKRKKEIDTQDKPMLMDGLERPPFNVIEI